MALAYNELPPRIPLRERYGNNPTVENVRVTGWPANGAPVFKNGTYAGLFAVALLITGQLKLAEYQPPAARNKETKFLRRNSASCRRHD